MISLICALKFEAYKKYPGMYFVMFIFISIIFDHIVSDSLLKFSILNCLLLKCGNTVDFCVFIFYPDILICSCMSSTAILQIHKNVLHRQLCPLKTKTLLFLLSTSVCLYLFSLHWRELPIHWWIGMVRVDVLFPDLKLFTFKNDISIILTVCLS